jgi:hypothetical protein
MLQSIGRVGQQLVQNIPRLENIAHGIGCQAYRYTNPAKTPGTLVGEDIPIIGRILKLLIDYDRFLGKDQNLQAALDELLKHVDDYDPKLFAVFRASISGPDDSPIKKNIETVFREQEVNIADLEPGMVLVRDVFDRKGRLVISTGTVITEILKRRLVNYCETQVIFDPVVIGDDRYIF